MPDGAKPGEVLEQTVPSVWRHRDSEGPVSLSAMTGLSQLQGAALPSVGHQLSIRLEGDQAEEAYMRERRSDGQEMATWGLTTLANTMTVEVVVRLIAAVALERQIVLIASKAVPIPLGRPQTRSRSLEWLVGRLPCPSTWRGLRRPRTAGSPRRSTSSSSRTAGTREPDPVPRAAANRPCRRRRSAPCECRG